MSDDDLTPERLNAIMDELMPDILRAFGRGRSVSRGWWQDRCGNPFAEGE